MDDKAVLTVHNTWCKLKTVPYLVSVLLPAAATAADFRVDVSENVCHDVTDVGEAEQHEWNPKHGIRDAHQLPPHCLRKDVAIPWGDKKGELSSK